MAYTPVDVLVIGAGMHVSGRGTNGYGTVLPAVFQAQRDGLVGRVLVAATNANSIMMVNGKMAGLNAVLGTRVAIEGFPKTGQNPVAYEEALTSLGKRGCVIIVVPDDFHFATAKAAIERRAPVMVTKPLTPTLAEAQEVDPNKTSALSSQSIKVFGTGGRFQSDQRDRGLQLVTEADGIEDINPYFTQTYPSPQSSNREYKGYGIDSIRTFLEDARSLLDGERTPADLEPYRPTLRQALVSTAVVEAVNQSLGSKSEWVPVRSLR